MVQQSLFFLLISLFCISVQAQDERYYRQILSGELPKLFSGISETEISQFNVTGSSYRIDLNDDQIEEIIEPQKRDGVDWIEIRNSSHNKIFESRLLAMGSVSEIYKIKLVHIKKDVKALLIFLDEGSTKGKKFESTARFFVLTYLKNDLSTITFTEGPHFFHERESQRDQYWRRDYNVNVYDINGDGTREIAVQYNHIQRIMKYTERGLWERL